MPYQPSLLDPAPRLGPETLWSLSRKLYARGFPRLARICKAANLILFRAVLPPEAAVGHKVRLKHYAMGVVIHPRSVIGDRVLIWQGATLASYSHVEDGPQIVIGDRAEIGTGAVIVCNGQTPIEIGDDARIGANSVVTRNVPAGVTVVPSPTRVLQGPPR